MFMFNCILSDAGVLDQDQTIKAGGINVAPEEITLGYWMAEGFGRRASGQERNCAKDIGVAKVNRRLGNKPQERMMRQRIGRSANQ